MKSLFVTVAFLLSVSLFSQTYQTIEVIKDVEDEKVIKLSSDGLGATFGKISRQCIPINLPPNTVSWSYVFSTELNNSNTQMFASAAKLAMKAGAAYAGGPAAAIKFNDLINAIPIPSGSSAASVYVLDAANAPLFLERKEFSYIIGGTVESQNNGKAVSAYVPGQQFFIGIVNKSSFQRIVYVKIKVYASVRETQLVQSTPKETNATTNLGEWTQEQKDRMLTNCTKYAKNNGTSDDMAKSVAECMQSKIVTLNTHTEFATLLKGGKWEEKLDAYYNYCKKKLYSINTQTAADNKPKEQPIPQENEKAVNYGNLGYKFFQADDYEHCIEYSKKALEIDGKLLWVKTNLGICYLIKGEQSKAMEYYMDALSDASKTDKKIAARSYLEDAITDINNSSKKQVLPSSDIIKSMLQKKIEQLRQ